MKHIINAMLLSTAAATSAFAAANEAVVRADSSIELTADNLILKPIAFNAGWNGMSSALRETGKPDGSFYIPLNNDGRIFGTLKTEAAQNGAVRAEYKFRASVKSQPETVAVAMDIPRWKLKGAKWETDEKSGAFADEKPESPHLFNGKVKKLALHSNAATQLEFVFDTPTSVLLQDNRQWGGDTITLRIMPDYEKPLEQNAEFDLAFAVQTKEALTLVHDSEVKLVADGKNWIPVKHTLDVESGSALDFSNVIPWHAPAGKFGRVLKDKNGHFVFAEKPDEPVRFYGVNLCFSANYLSHDESRELAARFRRLGYNAVRIHHHDDTLVEGGRDTLKLNPGRIDQFDFLMSEFIRNGIYITTDLYVSRGVPWRNIGVDRDGNISMDDYKILCAVNEGAMADWKKFSTAFLTHTNAYTGRTYADEPALAWLSLVNEGNLGNHVGRHKDIPGLPELWKKEFDARKAENPAALEGVLDTIPPNIYVKNKHTAAYSMFLSFLEGDMMQRMRGFLKGELRCEALLSNANGWTHFVSDAPERANALDYIDDHFYIDHPHFLARAWNLPSSCPNENPFKNDRLGMLGNAFVRMEGMPFTISEFNFSGPGRYRGVGGMATGVIAALQDWDILWRFAYSHSQRNMFAPSQMGYFDIAQDPVMSASERASLCLFMRGDIRPLTNALVIALGGMKPSDIMTEGGMPFMAPSWVDVGWKARIVQSPRGVGATSATPANVKIVDYAKAYFDKDAPARIRAELADAPFGGGAVAVDRDTGTFTVNTPFTAGGFTENGVLKAGAFEAKVDGAPASVWASSLDGKPLRESGRILIAHITDVQNTGITYSERARRTLLAWGGLPHIAEAGKAEIMLSANEPGKLTVWRLANDGKRLAKVETRAFDNIRKLLFVADTAYDTEAATLYYELVIE